MKDNLKFSSVVILIALIILLLPLLLMKTFEILGYFCDQYKNFLIFCGMDSEFATLTAPLFFGFSSIIFLASFCTFILTYIDEKQSVKADQKRSSAGRVRG